MSTEKWLLEMATEIAKEGHCGWANTCQQAADDFAALTADLAEARQVLEAIADHSFCDVTKRQAREFLARIDAALQEKRDAG
jgi:hypothetical protein